MGPPGLPPGLPGRAERQGDGPGAGARAGTADGRQPRPHPRPPGADEGRRTSLRGGPRDRADRLRGKVASAPGEQAARAELRAWLAESWDPQRRLVEWRTLLVDSGWAAPTWPEHLYGKGLP